MTPDRAGAAGAAARCFATGWLMHMKMMRTSRTYLLVSIIQPIIFATIALLLHRHGTRPGSVVQLALGAGLMGMWAATVLGSGGAISRQRAWGTLESLVASPSPLLMVFLPQTVAASSLGIYSVGSTLLWARLVFGVPVEIANPVGLLAALVMSALAIGSLGLLMAAALVLYPSANALSNLFELPVFILSGMLVPVSFLPYGLEVLSYPLAPTWGVRAVFATAGGSSGALVAITMCAALTVAHLALAAALLRYLERRARVHATLALT